MASVFSCEAIADASDCFAFPSAARASLSASRASVSAMRAFKASFSAAIPNRMDTTAPISNAITVAAVSPEIMRFRFTHLQALSVVETALAVIGSPRCQRPRSSARAFADSYRFFGSFCSALWQIVSRSRWISGFSVETLTGSFSITCISVSIGLAA